MIKFLIIINVLCAVANFAAFLFIGDLQNLAVATGNALVAMGIGVLND